MKFSIIGVVFVIVVIVLIDLYLYKWIRKNWAPQKKTFVSFVEKIFFWSIPIFFISGFIFISSVIGTIDDFHHYNSIIWFIAFFTFIYLPKVTFLIVVYLGGRVIAFNNALKKGRSQGGTIKYPKISRAKFLSQVGIIMASAPFLSLVFGVLKGRFNFFIKYNKLCFPNLPMNFDSIKIVHISDIHLGSFHSNKEQLEEAFDIVNLEKPDIICFTGDLVNNFKEEIEGWDEVFLKLKAPLGKFSILGNHDYGDYSKWKSPKEKIDNFNGIVDAHARLGFRLLRNESVAIRLNNQEIAITGVENWGHPPFPRYGDLDKAKKGTEAHPFRLLLSHDPDHWSAEVNKTREFDLTLAGHTHGMQFGLDFKNFKWSPAQYKFKYWDGLYQKNNQFLYVNRGLGYLGVPARIGMPPEITVLELVRGPMGIEPM